MWILLATSVLSLASAAHLWLRRGGSRARRSAWTLVVALPAIGPMLYLGMYQVPSALTAGEQASARSAVELSTLSRM
jgi:hypothetical protein